MSSLVELFSNQYLEPSEYGMMTDFDAAIWEMALAVQECDDASDSLGGMRDFVNGWISMEDNEFCIEAQSEEVKALMEIDILCKLKKAMDDEEEKPSDDGGDGGENEVDEIREPMELCYDTVNSIATMIKSVSVQLAEFGDIFGEIAMKMNDASDAVRRKYRRIENTRRAEKMQNSRQTLIQSYFGRKQANSD